MFTRRCLRTSANAVDSSASVFSGWLATVSHLPWLQVCLHLLNCLKESRAVNYCWPSPPQSILVSSHVGTHDHIFFLQTSYVLKWGPPLRESPIGDFPSARGVTLLALTLHGPNREHHLLPLFCCCVRICYRGH
jgi:hypothetical protein